MQIVLSLAEHHEQAAAKLVGEWRVRVGSEQEQLRQLEEYTAQYLETYSTRKSGLRAEEFITYSGFIQRLNSAQLEQKAKLERVTREYELSLQQWRLKYHRRESIADLIIRLQKEDNEVLEKRLQKELDELSTQQFSFKQEH